MHDEMPTVKMPILSLFNPDTGSRVTLVGMAHAAQPAYYAEIGRRIEVIEEGGAAIHYELVTDTPAQIEAAAPAVRDGAKLIHRSLEAELLECLGAGLVLQRDQLPPRASWQRHDVGLIEVAQFYGAPVLREREQAEQHEQHFERKFTPMVKRAFVLQAMAALAGVFTGEVPREAVFVGADRYLAIHREGLALAAVDLHLALHPGSDLALLWGAAHLPGFTAGLDKRGYKVESEEWVVAIDPSTLPDTDTDTAPVE